MRVLYLAHRIPDAPTKGDKIRSFHQLRALAARHEVHLVALDDEPDSQRPTPLWQDEVASSTIIPLKTWSSRCRAATALLQGGPLTSAHFAEPRMRRSVQELLQRHSFDVVVVYSGAMDPFVAGFRPRVLDLVDVDSEKFRAYHQQKTVSGLRRFAAGVEFRRLRELEIRASAEADATILCTQREASCLREFAQPRRLEVIGNGVDTDVFRPGQEQDRRPGSMVFVGAMDYQANVDAALILGTELLPAIQKQVPDATLMIVGRNPTPEVQHLAKLPGIEIHANVESVVPFLHRAALTLLPFRVARGIQNKALEAMATELPVVLSASTASGLEGQAGLHYRVGNDHAELIQHAVELLQDPIQNRNVGRQGRELVESRYSWSGVLQQFEALVCEVAQRGRVLEPQR